MRRGMFSIPSCFQLIFNKKLHFLLSRHVYQWLSWLVEVSIARLCSQQQTSQSIHQNNTNQSLISHIPESRLIPLLTKSDPPYSAPTSVSTLLEFSKLNNKERLMRPDTQTTIIVSMISGTTPISHRIWPPTKNNPKL